MALLGELQALFSAFRGTWLMPMRSVNPDAALYFDACTGRTVSRSSDIVDFAVEDGDATDNVHRNPARVELDCILSDTPTHPLALAQSSLAQLFGNGQNSENGIAKLRAWWHESEFLRVVTPRWEIRDLQIEGFTHAEDAETGASYRVALALKSVVILSSVTLPSELDFDAAQLGAGGTVDLGQQSPINPADYGGPITLGGG